MKKKSDFWRRQRGRNPENKYHAVKTGGNASGRESRRKWELEARQAAGEISDLRCQVPFLLIPAQYVGKRCVERSVKYIADFVYTENGQTVVEDSKGFKTKDYIIKRKLLLWVHHIRILET